MYDTNNQIAEQKFDKLQVSMLVKTDTFEIISINLEKGSTFPEHTSPTNAQLIVLEGDIEFHINGESYRLRQQQHFNFPKQVAHFVVANANSKFLIIR